MKKVPLHPSKTFEGKGQATGIKIRNGFDSVKENSITHKRSRYFVLWKIKYCRLTFLSDVIVFSDKEKQPVKSFLARYLFIKITQTNISVLKLLCLQSEIKRSNRLKEFLCLLSFQEYSDQHLSFQVIVSSIRDKERQQFKSFFAYFLFKESRSFIPPQALSC